MGRKKKYRNYLCASIPFEWLAKPKTKREKDAYEYRRDVLEKYLDRSIPFNELKAPDIENGIEVEFYCKRQELDCIDGIAVEGEDPDAYIECIAPPGITLDP